MTYLFDPDNWKWLGAGRNLVFILEGFLVNLEIAAIAMLLSLIIGLVLALLRVSKNRLVGMAGVWIDVWRNLPLILIILYLFLVLPQGIKESWEKYVPPFFPEAFQSGAILAAIFGLTLYNSAVIAEIMRAGIQSLERGQGEAAAALGLPYRKAMRLIILPQGLRRMVPATVSQLITLNKDTTLVSIIAIQEALRHARIVTNTSGSPLHGHGGGGRRPAITSSSWWARCSHRGQSPPLPAVDEARDRQRQKTGIEVENVTGLEDPGGPDLPRRPPA